MLNRSIRRTILAALATVAVPLAPTAFAADMIVEAPLVESQNGWYLRGDLAYNFAEAENANAFGGPVQLDALEFELDEAFSLGVGIGYQVNDNLRIDATVTHMFETEFDASFSCAAGGVCGSGVATADRVDVDITTVMANAYTEIGNYGGVTPYVGAGIGAAHMNYGTYISDTSDIAGTPTAVATQRAAIGDDWRFAWAVHAGAGIDLTENLKLDVGYTFTRIEDGEVAGPDGSGVDLSIVQDDGLYAHAIRAGLRWYFY
jgi:opacity protein-like surface antigen